MPSQTVHIPEDLYRYVITTKDDETTSGRVKELIAKGKEYEENHE